MTWLYTAYATPPCEGVPATLSGNGSSTDVYNEDVFKTKDIYEQLSISTGKLLPIQFGAMTVQFPNVGFSQVYEWGETYICTPKGPEYRGDFVVNYTGQFLYLTSTSYAAYPIQSMPLGIQTLFSVTDGWTHPYYSSKPSYVFWS